MQFTKWRYLLMRSCGCHLSGEIEQGAQYIRKSLIYSTRKAFLEKAVVELVYIIFDEKLYRKCLKRSLKYDSNIFLSTNMHIQVKQKAFKINAKIEDVGLNED